MWHLIKTYLKLMEKIAINKEKKLKTANPARKLAVKILNRYERSDAYLDKLIYYSLDNYELNDADRGLLTEICYGVMRQRQKLDWVLTGFFHGEFNKCLNLVKNAMRIALYQILFLDKIPHFSAIDESVQIVKEIQGERAAGLVNGVLRNIVRNLDNIRYPKPGDDHYHYLAVMHSHPKWLARRLAMQFSEDEAIKIMDANNEKPGLALRVNRIQESPENVIAIFQEKNVAHKVSPRTEACIHLFSSSINVSHSELFKQGKITVQDESAYWAVRLATPKKGQKILDTCSAPGGKTCLMAELAENEAEIIAIDKFPAKIELVRQNIERLGAKNISAFPKVLEKFKSSGDFDLVFLDAPCSGLGNLAKKPEIKWKRELEDILNLIKTQREMLTLAATHVKPGGLLVFSTCTIDLDENFGNAKWFLENNPDFELEPAENYIPAELCKDGYMATYWHIHGIGGAFAARFRKKA